jgi:hypothetical protein
MFRKDDQIYEAEENGEIILLNLRTGKFYGLNHIGSEIWKRLFTMETHDICHYIQKTYNVDLDIVQRDLEVLLRDLMQNGLVHDVRSQIHWRRKPKTSSQTLAGVKYNHHRQ